jgi:hypothetical protein
VVLEIQGFLAVDRHKNVARINWLIGKITTMALQIHCN